VRLDTLEQAVGVELGHDALARLEAIEAAQVRRRIVVQARVGREDVDQRQPVTHADGVVVEVVRRSYLQAAGAEGGVDVAVGDDRDLASGQWQPQLAPDQRPVAFIVRVYRDRGVPQHGLGARGGHHQLTGAIGQPIPHMPQQSVLLLGQYLQVRQRRAQHRIPVDQALAAVDQAFLMQAHEGFNDCARQAGVHGEALARPVHRGAKTPQLLRDGAARLLFPGPDTLDKGFARQIGTPPAFDVELPLDHHLCGNAGVVGTELPQRLLAAHAVQAYQRIHDRVLECVPHVQRAGHVRRRNHDAVAACSRLRGKIPGRLPTLIQTLFDSGGRVDFFHPGMRVT